MTDLRDTWRRNTWACVLLVGLIALIFGLLAITLETEHPAPESRDAEAT